jgi:outer membrane protein TolC
MSRTDQTRIDHANEARRAVSQTLGYAETDENTGALVGIAAAQVHATLALVEQQRIANLITLATLSGEYDENTDLLRIEAVASLVKWVPHGLDDEHPEIRPEIAAALGIGGESDD